MRCHSRPFAYACALLGSAITMPVTAAPQQPPVELRLASIFGDHMVLQRDMPLRIWGTAAPDERIEVEFAGQRADAVADDAGNWTATLGPFETSDAPRTLRVRSIDDDNATASVPMTIELNDVLVGEVWLCSGQSNMVWTIDNSANAAEFIAAADDPRIRMFTAPSVAAEQPADDVEGAWRVASPQTVGSFSAVAYHFGRSLAEELDVPVGLINASWGGSTIEAWLPRETLESAAAAAPFLRPYDAIADAEQMDAGPFIGRDVNVESDAAWQAIELPSLIEEHGHDIDGFIWFRRSITIPQNWAGKPLTLTLGAIDDNDITWFNGERIGATENWQRERSYTIPAELVDAGEAALAIRVEDTGGSGGFTGPAEMMSLALQESESEQIQLAGTWHMRIAAEVRPMPQQHRPANLYNGMIHPLRLAALRGAIWYQGESNATAPRGEEYFELFPALIESWRDVFRSPDLPFYFVQLPNFTNNEPNTVWRYPVVRQAQLETMRAVPHTGMAITLELGEANDIHPRNKHDVAARLARWALADTYEVEGIVKSGPIFREARFNEGGSVSIEFDLYGSTLASRSGGNAVGGFELAGGDGVFHAANATIQDDEVIVLSEDVPAPRAVRYAWRNNAIDADLINAQRLPASPFEAAR